MKFFKFTLALVLLPVLGCSWEFVAIIARQAPWEGVPWLQLASFGIGLSLAVSLYLAGYRPNWLYVLGHESTHALAVWMQRGRVSEFKARSDGGHIVADRDSTLISLSPYVFPFYPTLIAALGILVALAFPAWGRYGFIFLMLWGLSWGFHGAYTLKLIFSDQPDFRSHGRLYSLVLILLGNTWLLIAGLWLLLEPFPFLTGIGIWGNCVGKAYTTIGGWLIDAGCSLL